MTTSQKRSFFVHESSYVDEGSVIGEGTKIWHFVHIMQRARIGRGCNIGQNVVISPDVIVGNNVKIQNNVSVYTGVILEDDVFCGPSMVFTNVTNPRSHVSRKHEFRGVEDLDREPTADLHLACVERGVRARPPALLGDLLLDALLPRTPGSPNPGPPWPKSPTGADWRQMSLL